MKFLLGILFIMLAISNVHAQEDAAKPKSVKPALHEHPTLRHMLAMNNYFRAQAGRPPHRMSARLTQAAQDHARYMARTGQFTHHANGGLSARGHRYGYHGAIRENIASGQRTVKSAFESWRNSSGHWASIISSTSHAGFGYAISRSGETYWVGVYGNDASGTTASAGAATSNLGR